MVDLTVSGTSATINGALFISDAFSEVSGTGIFPSFVKIQSKPTEQGYNYDNAGGVAPQFDEGNDAPHNHAVLLADVTILKVNVEGVDRLFYVFGLDSNEPNSATKLLSLDALQIWTAPVGNLTGFEQPVAQANDNAGNDGDGTGFAGQGGTLVYDMDGAGDAVVLTNSQAAGSGRPDLGVFVPVENFAGLDPSETYVYLYSAFGYEGGDYVTNSGFEEWSTPQVQGVEASIKIEKVTGDGVGVGTIDDGDGVVLTLNDPVTWTYTVTNTGNVPLSNIKVTDSEGETPVYKSGDAGVIGVLEVGESWVYTATGTADQATYSNIGSVTGEYLQLKVSDDDPSSYSTKGGGNDLILIDIEKVTLDGLLVGPDKADDKFGDGSDDDTILSGEDITWIYKVTNTGNVALSDVKVTDDQLATDPVYATGDDGDNVLQVGETWYFTATGKADTEDYANTGTATGTYKGSEATDSDDSGYVLLDPHLSLEKETQDLGDPLTPDDDSDDGTPGDGDTILSGELIQWVYTLTNDGNVDLTNIVLVDDNGTPDTGDDYTFATIASLAAGEGITLYRSGTAGVGLYENKAVATADDVEDSAGHTVTPTADDKSSYFGANPLIDIEKKTKGASGVGADKQLNTGDDVTVEGDNIQILAGSNVTWTYTVKNTGNVTLSDLTVTDDKGVTLTRDDGLSTGEGDGKFDPGDIWVYTATGIAVAGAYSNIGTASGTYTDTADHKVTVSDSDPSSYTGLFEEARAGRTQGFWGKHLEAWDGKADTKWAKIVGPDKDLSAVEINNKAGGGDVLLGDVNNNGIVDNNEVHIRVSNAVAVSILSSSVQGDHRISFLQQAIATQLNIDNGDRNPGEPWGTNPQVGDKLAGDLITEAVQWLKAYGGSGSGTTTVSFADGTLDGNEYKSGKFVSSQTTAQDTSFWSTTRDVDGTAANVQADGENLKDVLEAFNQNKLVTSNSDQVGWNTLGEGGLNVVDVRADGPDVFWWVAGSHLGFA